MVSTEYIPLAEREKVLFDLKGYLLFPAVLSAEELAPLKAAVRKIAPRQGVAAAGGAQAAGWGGLGADRSSSCDAGFAPNH